ncbi:MAG TPA: response regulator [Bacteroidota bacterium]
MKVLIVDDEKDVEILFRQRFRKEVKQNLLELCYAFSGDEALEILKSADPTDIVCILSDINMPGMTGLELLKIVKEKFPQIKVSIITAYGDEQNYNTAMNTGAEHYFTKPIDFELVKKDVFDFSKSS